MFLLAAGCSRIEIPATVERGPGPVASDESASPAVTSRSEAEAVGKRLLETPGFAWLEPPKLAAADEMSYAEAVKLIGVGEGQYDRWPADTRVWLVIFEGRWELAPMGPPNQVQTPLPYEGCLMTVFAARDGSLISVGDAVCPSR